MLLRFMTLEDLDSESIEDIKIADLKEDDASGDKREKFRIWHCNGVPIGVHLHKNPEPTALPI